MVPWAQHFLWQRLPTCKALSWSCWSLCNTDKLSPMNSVRPLKDMILSQTLLRRSKKNISTSIKITKGLQWRLYPRYRVTFFSVTISINPGTKLHILSTLLETFTVQSELGTQTITFPLHNGLIFMAQVALGLSWMCTLPSPGFVPALEPSAFLCAF